MESQNARCALGKDMLVWSPVTQGKYIEAIRTMFSAILLPFYFDKTTRECTPMSEDGGGGGPRKTNKIYQMGK